MRNIFLDCGTHEGQGMAELGQLLPQGCEIHCFEANPLVAISAESLRQVADAVDLAPSSLTFHQTAVLDREGTVTFACVGGYPRGMFNNRGQSSTVLACLPYDLVDRKLYAGYEVTCIDLATFVHSLRLHDVDNVYVKLDIEGAEFDVVRHLLLENALTRVKVMWIEWHPQNFQDIEDKKAEVVRLKHALTNAGVEVYDWA